MNEKQIFEYYQHLKQLQKTNSGIDLELAETLFLMKKDDSYKVIMGYDEATWSAFIAQPELQPLNYAKAWRLVKIYETYIINLELKKEDIIGIDSNSLARLTAVVNKSNINDWLDKAKNLSRSDLRKEISGIDELNCKHELVTKTTKTCTICGYKETEK